MTGEPVEGVLPGADGGLVPGTTSPNAVITKLGTNGDVCLYTQRPAHLLADLAGYLGEGSRRGS